MAATRGITSFKYLSGVFPAVTNLTALAVTVPASMHTFANIPFAKAPKNIKKGLENYGSFALRDWGNKDQKLKGEDLWLMREIQRRGYDEAQYNMEAMSTLMNYMERYQQSFMAFWMIPFAKSEKLNRGGTIAGTYYAIREQHKGDWNDAAKLAALKTAKYVSDKAHGIYGKANVPFWGGGGGVGQVGRSLFMFKTFAANYVLVTAEMGVKDKKAAAYMLLAPIVVGGGGASLATTVPSAILSGSTPVLGQIAEVIFGLFGLEPPEDPEEDVYQFIEDQFGPEAEYAARFGLIGAGGADLRGSLAVNFDVPESPMEMFGAPYGMYEDVKSSIDYTMKGDYLRAAEELSFRAITAPLKAYREYNYGVTSKRDVPIVYQGKPLYPGPWDTFIRGIGGSPTGVSGPREELWTQRTIEMKYDEKRSIIWDRVRHWVSRGKSRSAWREIQKDIDAYNKTVEESGYDFLRPITDSTIKAQITKASGGKSSSGSSGSQSKSPFVRSVRGGSSSSGSKKKSSGYIRSIR